MVNEKFEAYKQLIYDSDKAMDRGTLFSRPAKVGYSLPLQVGFLPLSPSSPQSIITKVRVSDR